MLLSIILTHIIALGAILYRAYFLWSAIKQHDKRKIKFEVFLIFILMLLWVILIWVI